MTPSLRQDTRAATALEYAIVCPIFLMFVVGLISFFSVLQAQRALDFGVERALRYAAVHGGGGAPGVQAAFCNAAALVADSVGAGTCTAGVTVSPTTFAASGTVQVTATYTWNPPANFAYSPFHIAYTATSLFPAITLTSTGKMYVVY